jgi:calcium channel MID1
MLTSRLDDSCQVIFDLDFCDSVAYAVPSNTTFKFNDTALAEVYDNQARAYYTNFTNSLAQVACDAKPESQYSLARTCADCERDYKNWLCMVLIPRCEDWTAKETHLQPRNINSPFKNGSFPLRDEVSLQFNETYRENVAFTQSRNPLIDQVIKPGPYKEMKPCEDMCFDIVRSCPPQLQFACPNGPQRRVMYGQRDPDPNKLTCSFPGAVVKLNARGAAERLRVGLSSWLVVAGLVAVML